MISLTDNFNRANEAALGGNWETPFTAGARLASNQIDSSVSGVSISTWKASVDAVGANQFSQVTLATITDNDNGGVVVRAATATGYYAARYNQVTSGTSRIYVAKLRAGIEFVELTSIATTISAGSTLRLEAETAGSSVFIRVYVDGVQVGSTYTDSTNVLSSGQPGVFCDNQATNGTKLDDWGGGDLHTDQFNRSNAATLGSSWSDVQQHGSGGTFEIVSNRCGNTSSNGGDVCARYSGTSFTDDQYSQIVVATAEVGSFVRVGPAVRCSDADETYYAFRCRTDAGDRQIVKVEAGGTASVLASDSVVTNVNDLLRLEISGETLTAKVNGTTVLSFTDTGTSIVSGWPGIAARNHDAGNALDDWKGGDLEPTGGSYDVSLSESGSASDSVSSSAVFARSTTESGSATVSVSAVRLAVVVLTEFGSAEDIPAASTTRVGVLAESASATDVKLAATERAGAIAESGSTADSISTGLVGVVAISEAGNGADAVSAIAGLVAQLTEDGSAGDTISGALGAATYNVSVMEAGAAVDAVAAAMEAAAAVSESGAAAESLSAILAIITAVEESGSVADLLAGSRIAAAALAETGNTTESLAALITRIEALVEAGEGLEVISTTWTGLSSLAEVATAIDSISAPGDAPPVPSKRVIVVRGRARTVAVSAAARTVRIVH